MTGLSKLDDFESWLRATGAGETATPANRTIAAGILAVAGKGPVTAAHVATGLELARDAGITDVATLEQVGALLLAFEAGATPPAVVPEPAIASAPAEPPPALQISIRTSQPTPRVGDTTGDGITIRGSQPAPRVGQATGLIAPTVENVDAPAPTAPRRTRSVLVAVGALAVVGAAGAWWITRDDGEVIAPPPPRTAATLSKIPELDLTVAFPAGWRVIHAQRSGALVARGSEHQAFLATVPLVSPLAANMAGPALVAVAHDAEQGAAERLVAGAARYYSEGCEVAGEGLAICRGTATLAGDVVTLQTYLRIGPRRAVLAMFMAKPSVAEPAAIAASIVASLGG